MSECRRTPARTAGHGLMVPTGQEFAFVHEGVVVAMVEWEKPHPRTNARVYAPDQKAARLLPQVGAGLGEAVDALRKSRRLFSAEALFQRMDGCYRIDDRRDSGDHSYLIWIGASLGSGPTLRRSTVYHFMKRSPKPRLRAFREVCALMSAPNAVTITDTHGLGGATVDDDAVKARFDLNNRVTVWDLSRIYGR